MGRVVGLGRPLGSLAGGRVCLRLLGWSGCAGCLADRERCRRATPARPREYPILGLGGGAARRGVGRVMLCGARGPRTAAGAANVCGVARG